MGCHLITETMARRHELSMDSYDRLFPSQDTMPRGGFGNLIALPLQHGPRARATRSSSTSDFVPYPDDQQWAYLASLPRIDPATVERIAREAQRAGPVVGVRIAEPSTTRTPHRGRGCPPEGAVTAVITGPLPPDECAVLAQRLFVEKAGLPSPLLNQIKRLAAFQNPEFYKKQSMRLSTAHDPAGDRLRRGPPAARRAPRGCQTDLESCCASTASRSTSRTSASGEPLDVRFQGSSRRPGQAAATRFSRTTSACSSRRPASGKTVIGTYLVAARACSTLILVHRQPLLDQWLAQLALFLGLDPKEIGQIGAGKRRPATAGSTWR